MTAYSASQLQYLDHLGIEVWVDRAELAAMIPTPVEANTKQGPASVENLQAQLSAQQAVAPVTTTAQPQVAAHTSDAPRVSVNQPAPPVSQVQNSMQAGLQAANAVAQAPVTSGASNISAPAFPKQAHASATDKSAVEVAPNFNLQFWCYGSSSSDGVWLLSDEVELSRTHHMFAHNVAHFLQGKKRKPRHVGIFSWPMLDAPNVDQSAEVAKHYLQQHFAQLQQISSAKTIIAFKGCDNWMGEQAHISIPFSITDVLQNPLHKKALWALLLPHKNLD